MSFPFVLPPGMVAVYGPGVWMPTPSGLTLPQDYRVGTVYNIWDGGATYVYGGDTVFWKEGSTEVRVASFGGTTYTIVPARLVTKDIPAL